MRGMLLLGALLAVLPLPAFADGVESPGPHREITVMTRNLYLGADLARTITARSLEEFIAAVTQTFAVVQATNVAERAEALADEIEATDPDLIGLQEVALWRSQFPADFSPIPNATTVELDFLAILLEALARRGLGYAVVGISTGTDVEAPRFTRSGLEDLRFTDREVLLARDGRGSSGPELFNARAGHFTTNLAVSSVAGQVTLQRGWVSVDARVRGKKFRFITTHLETEDFAEGAPAVQAAQAEELLQGPADTDLPVVLLGDFNSRADSTGTATYGKLLAAGFDDAWQTAHPQRPGFTCCQAEDLRNPVSSLDQRIDLVLLRGGFDVEDVRLVGSQPSERTPSGLWSSDHAGVVATIELSSRARNGSDD
jgi:endonuclease/exonuclease/phosphatase family metal-dependent hydrolase